MAVNDSSGMLFGKPDEYYADSLRMGASPYGFVFQFGLAADGQGGDAITQAIVRMSPQHTVVMYQLMKKNLRAYEEQVGKIALPDALYADLELERDI